MDIYENLHETLSPTTSNAQISDDEEIYENGPQVYNSNIPHDSHALTDSQLKSFIEHQDANDEHEEGEYIVPSPRGSSIVSSGSEKYAKPTNRLGSVLSDGSVKYMTPIDHTADVGHWSSIHSTGSEKYIQPNDRWGSIRSTESEKYMVVVNDEEQSPGERNLSNGETTKVSNNYTLEGNKFNKNLPKLGNRNKNSQPEDKQVILNLHTISEEESHGMVGIDEDRRSYNFNGTDNSTARCCTFSRNITSLSLVISVIALVLVLGILFGFLKLTTSNSEEMCPAGWLIYSKKCYGIAKVTSENFVDASKICNYLGATLISICSANENEFIVNKILKRRERVGIVEDMWIGLKKVNESNEESFQWEGGSKLEDSCQFYQIAEDTGSCFAINITGYWNTIPCSRKLPFFCQLMIDTH